MWKLFDILKVCFLTLEGPLKTSTLLITLPIPHDMGLCMLPGRNMNCPQPCVCSRYCSLCSFWVALYLPWLYFFYMQNWSVFNWNLRGILWISPMLSLSDQLFPFHHCALRMMTALASLDSHLCVLNALRTFRKSSSCPLSLLCLCWSLKTLQLWPSTSFPHLFPNHQGSLSCIAWYLRSKGIILLIFPFIPFILFKLFQARRWILSLLLHLDHEQ